MVVVRGHDGSPQASDGRLCCSPRCPLIRKEMLVLVADPDGLCRGVPSAAYKPFDRPDLAGCEILNLVAADETGIVGPAVAMEGFRKIVVIDQAAATLLGWALTYRQTSPTRFVREGTGEL